MKLVKLLLIAVLLTPTVLALQFTEPAEGAHVPQGEVTFAWDTAPVIFSINDGPEEEISSSTTTTITLGAGTHNAVIRSFSSGNETNGTNETANVTFIVDPPAVTSQNITVSTDQPIYEVLGSARIRVTVTSPAQLNLAVAREGVTVDTYVLNVQQQTDFLYTLQAAGTYTLTVTGTGASATSTFIVQNTTLGVSIDGPDSASVGKVTSFESEISGGTAPYTYLWQFSDDTTSTSKDADHVFATAGNYTATLVVQDAAARQASAITTVSVTEQTYRLTVTVLGESNRLLKGAVVVVTDNRSVGRTAVTDSFGEVKFRNLSLGNYTLNVTYNDTEVSPVVTHRFGQTVAIDKDKGLEVSLPVPDPAEEEAEPEPTQQAATTAAQSEPEPEPAQPEAASFKSAAPAEEMSMEERMEIEKARSAAMDDLQGRQGTISRSDDKQRMLVLLGLSRLFDTARTEIQQATSKEQMDAALNKIPKDITVLAKDTTIKSYEVEEIQQYIDRFFTARQITEKADQKKYQYSIEQILPLTTMTQKRSVVRVIASDGSIQSTYTVFSRSMQAPEATTFVEVIPKEIAADASELHVDGSNEVLEADPIIRFLGTTYSYYVSGEVDDTYSPGIVPVPYELQEPPGLIGLVTVKLKLNDLSHGALYVVLLGALVGLIVAGNVYLRKNSSSSVAAFTELGDIAISTIAQGHLEIAAKYAKEMQTLHATLKPEERKSTQEILDFVLDAAGTHEFQSSVAHMRNVVQLKDTNAVVAAFDKVTHNYEQLSVAVQKRELPTFNAVHAELDSFISAEHPQNEHV